MLHHIVGIPCRDTQARMQERRSDLSFWMQFGRGHMMIFRAGQAISENTNILRICWACLKVQVTSDKDVLHVFACMGGCVCLIVAYSNQVC